VTCWHHVPALVTRETRRFDHSKGVTGICGLAQRISASFLPSDRRAHARAGGRGRAPGRGTSVAASPGMPDSTRSLVRQLRQQLGMTQEEFAHEIAVTVSTVNRWENAHAQPSKLAWKAIRDLARQRGVPQSGGQSSASV
jgi:DNA-binding XRE family transcriptional regulator